MPQGDKIKRVMCDISGTLVRSDPVTHRTEIDPVVRDFLYVMRDHGYEVGLFSVIANNAKMMYGAEEEQLTNDFGSVKAKMRFKGQKFDVILDDNALHAERYGYSARHELNPTRKEDRAFMEQKIAEHKAAQQGADMKAQPDGHALG